MLTRNTEQKLNDQFNREFEASNLYLSMSSALIRMGWHGFAHFFRIQAEEERSHAMKIFDYLHQRGAQPVIGKTGSPPADFKSLKHVFQAALDTEKKVTEAIHTIMSDSMGEKDYATSDFLKWFVNEQIEEENLFQGMLHRLNYCGEEKTALLLLDKESGQRKQ